MDKKDILYPALIVLILFFMLKPTGIMDGLVPAGADVLGAKGRNHQLYKEYPPPMLEDRNWEYLALIAIVCIAFLNRRRNPLLIVSFALLLSFLIIVVSGMFGVYLFRHPIVWEWMDHKPFLIMFMAIYLILTFINRKFLNEN